MKTQIFVLAALCAILFNDMAAAADDERVVAIIKNIMANERLYMNEDVKWQEVYQTEHYSAVNRDSVPQEQRLDCQSVSQGEMFFLNSEGTTIGPPDRPGDIREHLRKGYDGESTRVLELRHSYVGNIIGGPAYEHRMFDPHSIPLRFRRMAIPLSTYLSGRDAILQHPRGTATDVVAGLHPVTSYEKDEIVDGLNCHQIVSTEECRPGRHGQAVTISGRRVFWLAKERNYLPVRAEAYNDFYSKDIPIETCVLEDLREISPGVWFPFKSTMTVLDEVELLDRKNPVVCWRREWLVTGVSLNPSYAKAFFQDIKFPDGTPIYEIDNSTTDNIVKSYVEGGRPLPATAFVPTSGKWKWLIALNVGFLAALIIVVVIKRTKKYQSRQ